jgi:hypothetical protein
VYYGKQLLRTDSERGVGWHFVANDAFLTASRHVKEFGIIFYLCDTESSILIAGMILCTPCLAWLSCRCKLCAD